METRRLHRLFSLAAFILQNYHVVELRFLFWKTQVSRSLVLLGTFILGLLAGWLSHRLRKKDDKPERKKSMSDEEKPSH
ncbi:lipopolysaccharide assembly protein LapA domain-containing protein [Thermodesulfobacteriota bacterium]